MAKPKLDPESIVNAAWLYCSGRRLPMCVDIEDAVQEYALGAWLAGERADPKKHPRTLQYIRGMGAVKDWLRRCAPGSRSGQALTFLPVDAVELGTGRGEDDHQILQLAAPEPDEVPAELSSRLESALCFLSERARFIVRNHTGGVLTLKEIATRLGISESRASQIESAAIARMRLSFGNEDKETGHD